MKKPHLIALSVGIPAVLVIGCCGLGAALSVTDQSDTPALFETSAPTAQVSPDVSQSPMAEKAREATKSPEPASAIPEGISKVGTEVQPGTYKTVVPNNSAGCYWARLKGASGELDDIIANENTRRGEQTVVTIKPTDAYFLSKRCGNWVKM